MLYISPSDQSKISRRIKRLPQILKDQRVKILAFQISSTLILTYGICLSIFKHPIRSKIPDPSCQIYIGCFCYFALSVAAPFTGAHMNPAITMVNNRFKKNQFIGTYVIAQIIGGLVGALLSLWFFDVTPAPYSSQQSLFSCIIDVIAEIFGTGLFTFFCFYVGKLKYASGEYFGYLVISIMLIICRAQLFNFIPFYQYRLTFRKSCLNPTLGSIFQIIQAIKQNNYFLTIYCIPMSIGPFVGAYLGSVFFEKWYQPLYEEMKEIKEREEEGN